MSSKDGLVASLMSVHEDRHEAEGHNHSSRTVVTDGNHKSYTYFSGILPDVALMGLHKDSHEKEISCANTCSFFAEYLNFAPFPYKGGTQKYFRPKGLAIGVASRRANYRVFFLARRFGAIAVPVQSTIESTTDVNGKRHLRCR